ncbi:MAG: hypothetical protein PWR10_43 [Halanaerobiales bacterium]|nr:hypothetical protein [Halanaerobiales bacterium]
MLNFRERKDMIRDIFILALPAIMEMALNTLVGIADTLMISRIIGKEGLAAVGFANQIIFTLIFIFSSFNAGATAMVARSYGEKNYQRLNKIIGQNLTLNFLMGIIISLVSFFYAKNILHIFDISEIVLEMGTTYLKYVSLSQLFMFISFAVAAGLRGAGDTRTPMYITGTANFLNIIGNYVLMTGYGFFPELGIAGAAISTTFARGIAALLFLYILLNGKKKVKLYLVNLRISAYILKPLWRFSYAAALEQLFMQLAFFANGIIISLLDTTSEAAFRILINIESTSFMPAIGVSIATATLVGKHLGEDNPEKSLLTGKTAAGMGIVWGIIAGSIFILLPVPLLKIFTKEAELITKSIFTMKIAGLNQPLLAFMIIMGGALRGAGDTRGIMFITALRLWLMFIPLTYLFVIFFNFGVTGVWYAEITSFLVFALVIYQRFAAMEWARIRMF